MRGERWEGWTGEVDWFWNFGIFLGLGFMGLDGFFWRDLDDWESFGCRDF